MGKSWSFKWQLDLFGWDSKRDHHTKRSKPTLKEWTTIEDSMGALSTFSTEVDLTNRPTVWMLAYDMEAKIMDIKSSGMILLFEFFTIKGFWSFLSHKLYIHTRTYVKLVSLIKLRKHKRYVHHFRTSINKVKSLSKN